MRPGGWVAHVLSGLPIFVSHFHVVEFYELEQLADHYLTIARHLRDRVFGEPENFEAVEGQQEIDLAYTLNAVASDVKLLQVGALADILQSRDTIDGDGENLEGGHLAHNADVSQVIRA
eukprot:CAMPEP_0185579762 /NCGR_PEP_ID=MMETSP0434-20130131/15401_1 /TAXON_ID=626734 ORGANISM="Favella taraikaensis, Strain Fe Narragansett Bay" /NCGR_SAMPLE_ID=MMETSP0434 /ASSEMBLY_ACC=CAM_ASM_000379 /LENGTH=118 /DNA_ID=CAMNT_0028197857 /DNA_START=1307 /DNA_END=1663 /DNA_ORIENTATION=-